MQNFVFGEGELKIDLGNGKHVGREFFEEQKETLLAQIEQTTDRKKRDTLKAGIVIANTALRSLNDAAKELETVELEIQFRRLTRFKEDNRAAMEGAKQFRENVAWIADLAYTRFTGKQRPKYDPDAEKYFDKAVAPYRKTLFDFLSYEQAQQQADEFMQASLERRDWKAVIELPNPKVKAGTLPVKPFMQTA
jgi:hypothetical protein